MEPNSWSSASVEGRVGGWGGEGRGCVWTRRIVRERLSDGVGLEIVPKGLCI